MGLVGELTSHLPHPAYLPHLACLPSPGLPAHPAHLAYDGVFTEGDLTMRSRFSVAAAALAAVCLWAIPVGAQKVTKETVPGVTNFARLETTVACAGATSRRRSPRSRRWGSRRSSTCGSRPSRAPTSTRKPRPPKPRAFAYYSIPFNGQTPDPAAADRFLEAITTKGSEPAFIHCAGGNRAAAMWMIKRLAVDRLGPADKAAEEATALGLTSPALKQFAIDYAQSHPRK